MELRPVTKTRVNGYPARRRRTRGLGGWVRGAAAAVATSAGLWLVGCSSIHLAGEPVSPTFFECSEGVPDSAPVLHGPGSFDGFLCGTAKAWATIDVRERWTATIDLTGGYDVAIAHVIDPSGYEAARVSPGGLAPTVELTPGEWLVAITSVNDGFGWFELTIDDSE